MKLLLGIVGMTMLISQSSARCANDCSSHGECNEQNQCNCNRNHYGADCNLRRCPHGRSFVDSPLGDENGDNIIGISSIYLKDKDAAPQSEQMSLQYGAARMPHLGAEAWDEAHFYRVCSNKGTCDTATGTCQCFSGYEGSACHKISCPLKCNGHGICKSYVNNEDNYRLWDESASQYCQCDAGWSGSACLNHECPYGVDPVEAGSMDASSFVRIGFHGFFNKTATESSGLPYGKLEFAITLEDQFGDSWTTKIVDVTYDNQNLGVTGQYNLLPVPEVDSSPIDVVVKEALEALPGNVAGKVNVHSHYAAYVKKGVNALTFTNLGGTASLLCYDDMIRKTKKKSTDQDTKQYTLGINGCGIPIHDGNDVETAGVLNVRQPGDAGSARDVNTAFSNFLATKKNRPLPINFKMSQTTSANFYMNSASWFDGGSANLDGVYGLVYNSHPRYKVEGYSSRFPQFIPAKKDSGKWMTYDANGLELINGLNLFIYFEKPDFDQKTVRVDYQYSNEHTFSEPGITRSQTTVNNHPTTNAPEIVSVEDYTFNRVWDSTWGATKTYRDASKTKSHICSRRGLCQYETGTCMCFAGYTGVACGEQNALANQG